MAAKSGPQPPAAPRPGDAPATELPHTLDEGLEELRLDGVSLAATRARGLRVRDCELRNCDLSNLAAREGRMVRTSIQSSRATGLDWPEGSLQDVTLRDCHLGLASFRFAGLQRVTFAGCVLREADFGEARCQSVRFHDCDLTGANFAAASFNRSQLRGCTLEDLQGIEGLRGTAMEWADVVALAPALAQALGIGVVED